MDKKNLLVSVVLVATCAATTFAVGRIFVPPMPRWTLADLSLTGLAPQVAVYAEGKGIVQRRQESGWQDLKVGEALFAGDAIRVGPRSFAWVAKGEARVQLGSEGEFVIEPDRLQIQVGALRVPDGANRWGLRVGEVDVDVQGGPVIVSRTDEGVELWNRSESEARVDGEPIVPGYRALVTGDTLDIDEIEERKRRPVRYRKPRRVARGKTTVITGRVNAENLSEIAKVTVGGVDVEVDEEGSFTAVVPLKIGLNQIAIVTQDVFGNQDVYELPPVKRLSEAELRALKFEWTRDEGAETAWGDR